MARPKKDAGTTATASEARVLADIPGVAKCGDVLVASAETIADFVSIGQVDPHPDAVEYAKGEGAAVVTLEE